MNSENKASVLLKKYNESEKEKYNIMIEKQKILERKKEELLKHEINAYNACLHNTKFDKWFNIGNGKLRCDIGSTPFTYLNDNDNNGDDSGIGYNDPIKSVGNPDIDFESTGESIEYKTYMLTKCELGVDERVKKFSKYYDCMTSILTSSCDTPSIRYESFGKISEIAKNDGFMPKINHHYNRSTLSIELDTQISNKK